MAHRRRHNIRRARAEARIRLGTATLDDARRFYGNWLWLQGDLRAKLVFEGSQWVLIFRSSVTGQQFAIKRFDTGGLRGVQGYWWPGNMSLVAVLMLPEKVPTTRGYSGPLW